MMLKFIFINLLLLCDTLLSDATNYKQIFSHEINVLVIDIYDGDTLLIQEESRHMHKVRMLGIDAPELTQNWGKESKDALHARVYGKNVKILFNGRDKFKRILGKVILEDKDINLEQVRDGNAWHFIGLGDQQDKADFNIYDQAQKDAKLKKNGLWQKERPTSPWDYRRGRL